MPHHPQSPGPAIVEDPRRRRSILVAVSLALMAVVASVSGLNVAQPQLATTFDASQSAVLWMINAYTLTLAALLLPLGALGDRRGRRTVLLIGLVVFGAANAAAGLAPTDEVMLAARVLAGVGAAMIMPVTLSVITSTFPADKRSTAIGVWTAVAGGGGLLGMYLSAVLVDVVGWRWLFVLPLILVVAAGLLGARAVPVRHERPTTPFDRLGAATSVVAAVGLTLALHEGPVQGWAAPVPVLALLAGVGASALFVRTELRTAAPLLDVRHFRSRGMASGSTLLVVMFGVQAGFALVLYPYFQVVLGWSGLRATLGMLPMALLMMVASGLAPRVAARAGARATMALGVLVAGVGLALVAVLVSADGGYGAVLPGLAAIGLGMGLAMTPSTEAITSSLPREEQGVASAVNDLTRELGSALGIALLGALLTSGYQRAIEPALTGLPDGIASRAREGVVHAVTAGADAGPDAQALVTAAQDAFVTGWQQAMWVGVAVTAALLVLVVTRGPRRDVSSDGTSQDAHVATGASAPAA